MGVIWIARDSLVVWAWYIYVYTYILAEAVWNKNLCFYSKFVVPYNHGFWIDQNCVPLLASLSSSDGQLLMW